MAENTQISVLNLIKEKSRAIAPKLVEIRRHLHQNPELSYKEFETSNYLKKWLEPVAMEVRTDYAETGLVGIIQGNKPGSVVALRGDIDALPIKEQTGLSFASKNKGVMHACGHDSHATVALGAGLILSELKDQLKGCVKIILQPGEEKNPGGASIMVGNGVLKDPDVDVIFGVHSDPRYGVGEIGYRDGATMAEANEFIITIKGKGGHGATPHLTIDPIVIAAHVILSLQNISSRMVDQQDQVVVTVGKVCGGKTANVIPTEVELMGTVRTFKPGLSQDMEAMMRRIVGGITSAYDAENDFKMSYGSPAVINDEEVTQFLLQSAHQYIGENNCHYIEKPSMGAEDFSIYLQEVPGCFFRLGTGNQEKGITSVFHQSTYDIDEDALPIGAGFMAYLAYNYLANQA